jgi:circadian clock protein KaiB
MPKRERSELAALEAAAHAAQTSAYVFHLVISGPGQHSATALLNVRRFCEERLSGRYTLTLTNLAKNPGRARELEIFATPTLIRELPLPRRRFVGNMVRMDAVLLPIDRERPAARPPAP